MPGILGAVALVRALTLLPAAIGRVVPGDRVRSMDPDRPAIEIAREAGGLLIIAAWMAVLDVVPDSRGRGQGHPALQRRDG